MPYSSGSYSFVVNSWNPAVAATNISATDWNAQVTDLSTALSTAVLKDGTQTTTALVPFAQSLRVGTAGSILGFVDFSGNTSGTTRLQPAAAASGTLTLPAATDTLVGRATTDTLTNKTLTSPSIGGTVSGGATYTGITLSGTITGPATSTWSSTGLGLGISPLTILDVKTGTNQVLRARGPISLGSGVSWNAENDAGSANISLEIRTSELLLTTGTGGLNVSGAGVQLLSIPNVVGANRYCVINASNGGNPQVTVSGGELAVGTNSWTFGVANVVSPTSPNRTLTVTIGGTTYYIAAKTTND